MPHQNVPLVPKAASPLVAPNTPPADAEEEAAHLQQQEAMRLKACKQVAELEAKSGPKPPSTDPLQYFAQAQANVPLVIDR